MPKAARDMVDKLTDLTWSEDMDTSWMTNEELAIREAVLYG